MLGPRNLAAFLLGVQLAACAHTAPARGRGERVSGEGFSGLWSEAAPPAPGRPALLIGAGLGAAGFSTRLATAALEAGISALVLDGGDPARALAWLRARADHVFAAQSEPSAIGSVSGRVLLRPSTVPATPAEPCLVLRGGEPTSTQHGLLWEVSLPDLAPGQTPDEHTLFELIVLWLRARAAE